VSDRQSQGEQLLGNQNDDRHSFSGSHIWKDVVWLHWQLFWPEMMPRAGNGAQSPGSKTVGNMAEARGYQLEFMVRVLIPCS